MEGQMQRIGAISVKEGKKKRENKVTQAQYKNNNNKNKM